MRQFSRSFLLPLFSFFLIAFTFPGCNLRQDIESFNDMTLRPEIALPLLNTTFTIDSLLPRISAQGIETDLVGDGLVMLAFEDSLYRFQGEELLVLNSFSAPIENGTTTIPLPFLGGGTITQATVKTGRFRYSLSIGLPGEYDLVINLPDAQIGGQPLTLTRTIAGPADVEGDTLLDGYSFVMPDGTFDFTYSLREKTINQEIPAQSFVVGMDTTEFTQVRGNFSDFMLDPFVIVRESGLLGRFTGEDVSLFNPRLIFTVRNTIGAPIAIRFNSFRGVTPDFESIDLEGDMIDNGVDLSFPNINQVGQTRTTVVQLDNSNSNMSAFANFLPSTFRIDWQFGFVGSQPEQTYFITEENSAEVDLRTEIPLDFSARNLLYVDTFRLKAELPSSDLVEWAEFKLLTDNGMPLDLALQIYFMDSTYAILDSVISDGGQLVTAAPVDNMGRANGASSNELTVRLTDTDYQIAATSEFLSYRLTLNSTDLGSVPVRLFSGDTLGLKLGLRTQLRANTDIANEIPLGED